MSGGRTATKYKFPLVSLMSYLGTVACFTLSSMSHAVSKLDTCELHFLSSNQTQSRIQSQEQDRIQNQDQRQAQSQTQRPTHDTHRTLGIEHYSAPQIHLTGENIATKAITEYRRGLTGLNSTFFEFTRDPRFTPYKKQIEGRKPLDIVEEYLYGRTGRTADVDSVDEMNVLRSQDAQVNSKALPEPQFFVTWAAMGIRAINRLIEHRIHLVGLIDGTIEVDGLTMDKVQFVRHDLDHAMALDAMTLDYYEVQKLQKLHTNHTPQNSKAKITIRDRFSRRLFESFSYEAQIKNMSESERVLFDIGYFVFFREDTFFDQVAFGAKLTDAAMQVPHTDLLQIYRSIPSSYEFELTENGDLQVKLSINEQDLKGQYSPLKRFLNSKDLRGLLPPEVERKIQISPSDEKLIIKEFLEETFSFFFARHFKNIQIQMTLAKLPKSSVNKSNNKDQQVNETKTSRSHALLNWLKYKFQ
jgi:hypothetical protein